MPKKVKTHTWIISCMMVVVSVMYTLWIIRTNYYKGDSLPFFDPYSILAVLLYMILLLGFVIKAVIDLILKRWRTSLLYLLPLLAIFMTGRVVAIIIGPHMGWDTVLRRNDSINRIAIQSVQDYPDYSGHEGLYGVLLEDQNLRALPDFKWFGSNHAISARNGVFSAFKINGVVHIRTQKVRYHWIGVAFLNDPNMVDGLISASPLTYEKTIIPNWLIWTI